MRRLVVLLTLWVVFLSFSLGIVAQPVRVRFAVTGDIMQHDSQIAAVRLPDDTYDYSECFDLVTPILRRADIALGNLELTFGGKPYRGYPAFSAPDALAYALRDAGFDVVSTANNHSCDRGNRGVLRTLTILDSAGLLHTGTYASAELRRSNTPLVVERQGKRIAFLSYTYGTNGIPFTSPVIVNLFDTVQMAQDLAKARQSADVVIVSMHWGEEYQYKPSAEQQQLAHFLYRHGVTVVVGNHPHVVQPIWVVADSVGAVRYLCLYSLGNFVSAQRTYPRAGSAIVGFTLQFDGTGVCITEGKYILTYVEQSRRQGRGRYRILPLETLLDVYSGGGYVRRYAQLADSLLGRGWGVLQGEHRKLLPLVKPIGFEAIRLRSTIYPTLQPY